MVMGLYLVKGAHNKSRDRKAVVVYIQNRDLKSFFRKDDKTIS